MPLEVPAYLIESVPVRGQVDAVAQRGEFVYAAGDQVYLGSIVQGTRSLFTADDGYKVMGVDEAWSDQGPLYGWAEGKYDAETGRAPCSDAGSVTWRLFASDGSQTHPITSGVNSSLRGCTAAKPLYAFDGNEVAYAVEAPRDGHPNAWAIHVVNVLTGASDRNIDTDEDLFSLDFENGIVVYTEGTLDPNVDPNKEFGTRLMLSSPDEQRPQQIAADAYHVSLFEGRLAWVADQSSSQRDENAPGPQIMTATVFDLTPRSLGPLNGPRGPIAGGDLITWVEAGQIVLADPNLGVEWRVSGTGDVDSAWASSTDQMLDWVVDNDDGTQTLDTIPLAKALPELPEPTELPSPTPSATPAPTTSPTPSPSTSGPPAVAVRLPSDKIRTVQAYAREFAQSGSLVAYADGTGVELVDLEQQSTKELYRFGPGEDTSGVAMTANTVIWTVDKYDTYAGPSASCPWQGDVSWTINAYDLATSTTSVVASGRHTKVVVCGAEPPPIAISGDLVAYGREGTSDGWTIVVQSLSTGEVVRSIDTEGRLDDVALDGQDVAYDEDYWPGSRLMISTAAAPDPQFVMNDATSISFASGRLAWTAEGGDGDEVWTATVSDPTPVKVSSDDYQLIFDVHTADGYVSYATSTGDSGIALWDERTGRLYELLERDAYPDDVVVGGGWIAWYDPFDTNPAILQGLPLSEVPRLGK
ncbi:MAG TPA: hypothetical protein VIK08_02675 [Candidatus Limnocylindrales bacterium]